MGTISDRLMNSLTRKRFLASLATALSARDEERQARQQARDEDGIMPGDLTYEARIQGRIDDCLARLALVAPRVVREPPSVATVGDPQFLATLQQLQGKRPAAANDNRLGGWPVPIPGRVCVGHSSVAYDLEPRHPIALCRRAWRVVRAYITQHGRP